MHTYERKQDQLLRRLATCVRRTRRPTSPRRHVSVVLPSTPSSQPRLMRPYAHAPSLQRQNELLGLDRAIGKTSRASRCGLVQPASRAEHGSFMASQIQARTELGSARLVSSLSSKR